MIRMGKSSKLREPDTMPEVQESPINPAVSLMSETQNASAFSESELMARDIKEGRLSGFVGGGTVLTGETTFDAMLRVDGHLKGSVCSDEGTLIIGSTGQVDADIMVASAVINGAVNGNVTASEKLTLGRTARVVGNVHTPRLIIEDGAALEGSCSMIKSREALEDRIAEREQALSTSELEAPSIELDLSSIPVSSAYDDSEDSTPDEEDLEENAEAANN